MVQIVSTSGPAASAPGASSDFQAGAHVLRDGATMAYVRRAAADGQPTVILIPETHGDRHQFLGPLVDALPRRLGVVVVESRGQGGSWPPPDPSKASIEAYATDVLEVVAALAPADWYVGGHSLGGMQAIEIAGRRPAGLRGVIALEGWPHHRVQAEAFGGVPPRTPEQREADRAFREDRYARLRWTPEEYDRLVTMWRRWTAGVEILGRCEFPVLSVWGDRGLAARPDRRTLGLPECGTCDVVWIPGADHYVTREPYASAVGTAIARFVERVETARKQVP